MPIACVQAERLISRLLDDELLVDQRDEVAGHVAACVQCCDALESWAAIGLAATDMLRRSADESVRSLAIPGSMDATEEKPGWSNARTRDHGRRDAAHCFACILLFSRLMQDK